MSDSLIQLLLEEGWVVSIETNHQQDTNPYEATARHTTGETITAKNNTLDAALSSLSSLAHKTIPFNAWQKEREIYITTVVYVNIGTDQAYTDEQYIQQAEQKITNALTNAGLIAGDTLSSEIQTL